jgi:hypothetical protein
MKLTSLFLIVFLLFPFPFFKTAGMPSASAKECPYMMPGKGYCESGHREKKGDCAKGCGCSMMFSPNSNIFIVAEALVLKPLSLLYVRKSFCQYRMADLHYYYPSDWKPPKY